MKKLIFLVFLSSVSLLVGQKLTVINNLSVNNLGKTYIAIKVSYLDLENKSNEVYFISATTSSIEIEGTMQEIKIKQVWNKDEAQNSWIILNVTDSHNKKITIQNDDSNNLTCTLDNLDDNEKKSN